ncbi:MAG TPA: permease [Sedimentisphaerales bacterium]|nr:permease [Sedimentisphaerales bacterium]
MNWKSEWKSLAIITAVFLGCFYLPVGVGRFDNAVVESLSLVKWYAREHVLLCLVPAFFIAGAIAVFISQASVMTYLGAGANKVLAYSVASVSGTILAVCSCTVLPLFAGIYKMGAGLGPATAFLYSGPAINVLAIILTARVLGLQMGVARAVGAIFFSIVIGLVMHVIYRKDEIEKANSQAAMPDAQPQRSLMQTAVYFASMVGILVFANWARPTTTGGLWFQIYSVKWGITGILAAALILMSVIWFRKDELGRWVGASWDFSKQILPLLLFGVLVAGFLLGRASNEGIIPSAWVIKAVGGNSIRANLFASAAGAFMYFATLTEVPILQGLMGAGMSKGPALALLLAGPALSLPNMLVIRSVMGTHKTIVFVLLVIVMATISGVVFGAFF